MNADEAALGYNAYSLLTTGRDEHGHAWPINLESFGDFKPAGYAYMLIPFVKVLGLTELAVRLPSALFGILGVLGIYLLTKELFNRQTGQLAALMLAISPWHLH
ncbi:MAG: glycosyltransferase family 39 protein, partial [Patescibacteria group bacterium]